MITLLTLTRGNQPLMSECFRSVDNQTLAPSAQLVTMSTGDYARDRVDSILRATTEYVAFLDDDDTLEPSAIEHCMAAIAANPMAGMIATDENVMTFDGSEKRRAIITKSYLNVTFTPRSMHALCVMKKSAIDLEGAMAIHAKFGMGIDWCLKASAALRAGAVHIPVGLYNWRQTPDGMTGAGKEQYSMNMPYLGAEIRSAWKIPARAVTVFR